MRGLTTPLRRFKPHWRASVTRAIMQWNGDMRSKAPRWRASVTRASF